MPAPPPSRRSAAASASSSSSSSSSSSRKQRNTGAHKKKKYGKRRRQKASVSVKKTTTESLVYIPPMTRVTSSSPPLSLAHASSSSVFAGQCSGAWAGTAADVSPRTGQLETVPASDSCRLHAGVITVDSPQPPASLRRSLCLLSSLSPASSSQAILDEQRDAAASWLQDDDDVSTTMSGDASSPYISTETSAMVDSLGTLPFSDGSYTLGPEQLDVTGAPIRLEFCIAANHTRVHSRVRVIVKLRLFAAQISKERGEDDDEEDEMSLDVFGVRVVREDWIAPSVAVKARRNDIVNYALEQGSLEKLTKAESIPLSWMSSSESSSGRRWTYSQTRADVL